MNRLFVEFKGHAEIGLKLNCPLSDNRVQEVVRAVEFEILVSIVDLHSNSWHPWDLLPLAFACVGWRDYCRPICIIFALGPTLVDVKVVIQHLIDPLFKLHERHYQVDIGRKSPVGITINLKPA